jgi:hypothetical protein
MIWRLLSPRRGLNKNKAASIDNVNFPEYLAHEGL